VIWWKLLVLPGLIRGILCSVLPHEAVLPGGIVDSLLATSRLCRRIAQIPMKKIALLGLALALAGGTFLVAKKQSCGACCSESAQESATVAGGNGNQDRVAASGQK
jgi:hypothetical protein